MCSIKTALAAGATKSFEIREPRALGVVGLGRGSVPLPGHVRRCRLVEFEAGGSVGPQLHSGKLLPNFSRRFPVSRFSVPLRPRNFSDPVAAHPAHRPSLLSPCAVLRDRGRPGNDPKLADSGPCFARRIAYISSCCVSIGRAAYCAGNLLRLSPPFLRS